jgi:hypothetical protein
VTEGSKRGWISVEDNAASDNNVVFGKRRGDSEGDGRGLGDGK